jgi:putative hemolysin
VLLAWTPWLLAMGVLVLLSGFFSASEAALFYLNLKDRRALHESGPAGRIAVGLLDQPDRLLTAVLFWNLLVNIAYFALTATLGIELGETSGESAAVVFSVIALLVIIFFSEMLPKSLAVLRPAMVASLVAVPLALAVRVVDPLIPVFRTVILLSRRLLWPTFKSEPYLEVADLERAVQLSTTEAELLHQEEAALQNIVSLSYLRADELMRPRTRLELVRPPVSIDDLRRVYPSTNYLFVTEPDRDEITAAIPLAQLSDIPPQHVEHYAEELLYVPWCATVAGVLEQMQRRDYRIAAVVNELGETVGVLMLDDILDMLVTESPAPAHRPHDHVPIQPVGPNQWHVAGMTNLRRLGKYLHLALPPTHSVTVSGVVQEMLERVPQPGDRCRWGPLDIEVLEIPERGSMLVRVSKIDERPTEP